MIRTQRKEMTELIEVKYVKKDKRIKWLHTKTENLNLETPEIVTNGNGKWKRNKYNKHLKN